MSTYLGDAHDPTGGEVAAGFGPLPKGNYTLALVKAERKPSKADPNNEYVACEFQVTEGQHATRRVWTNFNLWNNSAQALEIAWRDFNAFCEACGKLRPQDMDVLIGIPFTAYISVDKNDPERNKIASYKPLNAAPQAQQQRAIAGPAGGQAAAAATGAKPWRRSGT